MKQRRYLRTNKNNISNNILTIKWVINNLFVYIEDSVKIVYVSSLYLCNLLVFKIYP